MQPSQDAVMPENSEHQQVLGLLIAAREEELDEDEVAIAWNAQLTRKQAMLEPDADQFVIADTMEKTQLEALDCWRPVTKADEPYLEVIPSCVLYTRKRDGRHKARIVALGNHQKLSLQGEIYAPTISHSGNRYMLVEACSEGHEIAQFDISDPFTFL